MTPADFAAGRHALGLTQAQLAAVMGYGNKARISEIERGERLPPLAERLLRAYLDGYRPDDWPVA